MLNLEQDIINEKQSLIQDLKNYNKNIISKKFNLDYTQDKYSKNININENNFYINKIVLICKTDNISDQFLIDYLDTKIMIIGSEISLTNILLCNYIKMNLDGQDIYDSKNIKIDIFDSKTFYLKDFLHIKLDSIDYILKQNFEIICYGLYSTFSSITSIIYPVIKEKTKICTLNYEYKFYLSSNFLRFCNCGLFIKIIDYDSSSNNLENIQFIDANNSNLIKSFDLDDLIIINLTGFLVIFIMFDEKYKDYNNFLNLLNIESFDTQLKDLSLLLNNMYLVINFEQKECYNITLYNIENIEFNVYKQ